MADGGADLFGSLNDIGKGVSGLGGAVSSLFSSEGSSAAAEGYDKAAKIADTNADIAKTSYQLQQTQAARQFQQTLGSQKAEVASAGFRSSGSALNLMADSASQGAITQAMIGVNGQIQVNGYQQQAQAYEGEEAAAKSASSGGLLGGLFSGIGGLFSAGKGIASIASMAGIL